MALHNLSLKLNKELLIGLGGKRLLERQLQEAERETRESTRFLDVQTADLENQLHHVLQYPPESIEELRTQLSQLGYDRKQADIDRLRSYLAEREDYSRQIQEQIGILDSIRCPVVDPKEGKSFWLEHGYSVHPNYTLNILDLETSKVDFFAVSRNRKVAFLLLLELNRNAPESNVLKLYYYLKNARDFWAFEDIVILQVFSPKYIVEKRGKSLSLAREMASFLGTELFTGIHSFGDQKVRIHYNSCNFAESFYEIYSVFWKLMADEKDEEDRFELMVQSLPGNKNFLSLCQKFAEREKVRKNTVPSAVIRLIEGKGGPDEIRSIFRLWVQDILHFVEMNISRYHNFSRS